LDVLKNDMLVIDGVGQNRMAPVWEEVIRGMLESLMESSILNQATGQTNSVGIGEVFGALGDPNQLVIVGPRTYPAPSNPEVLTSTTLSADAQTLILNAVANGNVVMAPNQMLTVNGVNTVGWWETNPGTGHTISHFANGGDQATIEAVVVDVANSYVTGKIKEFIGRMEGLGFAGIEFAGAVLQGVAADNLKVTKQILANPPPLGNIPPPTNPAPVQKYFNTLAGDLLTIGASLAKASGPGAGGQLGLQVNGFLGSLQTFEAGLASGYYDGIKWLTANLPADPDALQFISTPLGPVPAPTPDTTLGVQVGSLTVDPTYTMPLNGNSAPLVFDLPITNTGPSTDTFNIQIQDESSYFQIYPTIGSLTLLGGQTGMVNVCVAPYDSTGTSVAPLGQTQNYIVNVTSATNPSITASASPSFNAPALPSLNLSVDPSAISVVPGAMVSANLNLASVGNVAAGPMTLTATLPTGITLSGLTSPITVPLNSTATEALTFSVASNVANGTYNIFFAASFTPSGGTIQQTNFVLPVTVTALGTCTVSSAAIATRVGKATLAADLAALVTDMNAAAATPSNLALANRVVGDMNVIISQELPAFFAASLPGLTAATNAVAAATPATLLSALSNLSSALCVIGTTLNQASTTSTSIFLQPSGTLADTNLAVGPNQTAIWNIILYNNSPVMHVYNLSATGVPSGVGLQFSSPTITLGPAGSNSYASGSTTVALTTGATFNTPFSFNVTATPADAPEFPVSALGTLQARPESINVDQVTATPQFGNAGTPVTVSARVFAVVNEQVQAQLILSLTDPNGNSVCCNVFSDLFTLTPSSTLQTITFSLLSTFANNLLTTENGSAVPGFQEVTCAIYNTDLIVSYSRYDGNTTANSIPTHFATFSLTNALSPVQLGSVVDIQRGDSNGLYVAGNTALMFQSTTFYNPYSNFIFAETGDIWAADLTNAASTGVSYLNDVFTCGGINSGTNQCNNSTNVPAATFSGGVCVPNGTTPVPNSPTGGGPYRIFSGTAVNSNISYFGSTNANGGDIEEPACPAINGQLLVVDTSDPAHPAILSRVDAPAMTFMTGIAVQGSTALAVGDSTGIYDINSGFVGTLVISSFDTTNPANPVLLNSVTTTGR
jgi:hypothetical protein